MEKIIKEAIERGASDLHIKAGDVFRARIDGVWRSNMASYWQSWLRLAISLGILSNMAICGNLSFMNPMAPGQTGSL